MGKKIREEKESKQTNDCWLAAKKLCRKAERSNGDFHAVPGTSFTQAHSKTTCAMPATELADEADIWVAL